MDDSEFPLLRKTTLKICSKEDFWLLALFLSSSVPIIIVFINAQNLLFSMAFFMLSYYLSQNKNSYFLSVLSGILLGISFFKYSIIFFILLIFIYNRKFIELITAILMHVFLTIFSMFWLNTSLSHIILSPVTSSLGINTGRGFIDLMTILNGGLMMAPFFNRIHGGSAYYIIFFITYLIMIFIAIKRKDPDEQRVFSLYCALSTILIYHRQYDFFILIIPLYHALSDLIKQIQQKCMQKCIILSISIIGILCILHGNWLFRVFNISIESGVGFYMYYGLSIVGLYLFCLYYLIEVLKNTLKGQKQ